MGTINPARNQDRRTKKKWKSFNVIKSRTSKARTIRDELMLQIRLLPLRLTRRLRCIHYELRRAFSMKQPCPPDPVHRFMGYDWVWLGEPHSSIPLRLARWVRPSISKVRTNVPYWREDYESLDEPTAQFWGEQFTDLTKSELKRHFHSIRDDAWQVEQEFSFARWWFLRSTLGKNRYYWKVLETARGGATIIDLACGLGQELRWLRAAGATGHMFAVDVKEELWNLGLQLFGEDSPEGMSFQKINIIEHHHDNLDPLHGLVGKADVILLNDFLSFLGPLMIEDTIRSISKASSIGTMVIGWAVGQEDNETMGERVWGNGGRGTIHNLTTFQQPWLYIANVTKTKWEVQAQLVSFEQLGFDKKDCEWFTSSYFDVLPNCLPMSLKGLCFLATRVA